MRILFISNLYPPHDLGGWEQNCQEAVELLQARGHDCHVLTSRHGVDGQSPPEPGVTRALHLQADIHHYRPHDFFLRRPFHERSNRRALRSALDAFRPDVLFIWGMWNLSREVAYWAEQWLPGRVAYAVAGYWLVEPDAHGAYWREPARRRWARWLMAPARWLALRTLARERAARPLKLDHVTCVSEYVRRKLGQAGALPYGARVIYNGIDPGPFLQAARERAAREDGLRLVYTGSLVPHKGVHTAIEALGLLRARGQADGLQLTIVGGGHPEYVERLEARIAELGLEKHVSFIGSVPRAQIPGLLSRSQVFLFTSVWEEPIARSVMEAMAAGLVVIGTPVGGQVEILEDGVNALVFPPGDAAKLAECIVHVQNDQHLGVRLVRAGQRTILERFVLRRMVDEMEEWLNTIVL
jgi:glycogen synthase